MPTNINFNKVLGTNKGCNITLASNPVAPLLLDTYPNAAVAYSLRKLREGYKKVFNLLSYSEDISQATYSKIALITTSYIDVETAPNGTMTADKLIEDTSFTNHFLTQTLGITVVGLNYNFSFYVKAAGRNKVVIQAGGVGQARINLLTGSIETTIFPITPVVTDAGNGWWRFSVTFNANSTLLNPLYRIFTVNSLDSTSYVGDGVSGVYVWGFQLTQSSTVLPYEKTVASPETGAAIRVRRSSDNAEQNIGFAGNNLDTASLLTFCGASNGFVTTWYDQSGNGNNSVQSTAVNQAQIVLNGNLILDPNTNKITTTWTNDRYTLTSGISTNTQYLSVSMHRIINSNDAMTHLGNSTTSVTPLNLFGTGGFVYTVRSYMLNILVHTSSASILGRNIITSLKNSSNLKMAFRNGVQLPNTQTEVPTSGTLNTFGQISTLYTSGQYQEYVYWDSEQSANRVAIETNIDNYWNIY